RTVRLVFLRPALGQRELARGRERHHPPFDLERADRRPAAHVREHVDDKLARDTHVYLVQVAPALEREARPRGEHAALLVDDDAVEVARAVHERYDLEVRVAEAK